MGTQTRRRQNHGEAACRARPRTPLYTFLRNEPNLFSRIFLYIMFIYRILRSLQQRLQMGSFSGNEPICRTRQRRLVRLGFEGLFVGLIAAFGFVSRRRQRRRVALGFGKRSRGRVAAVTSLPRSSPERNSGRAGAEVAPDSTSTNGAGAQPVPRFGSGRPAFHLAFWQNLLHYQLCTGISADPTVLWGKQLRGM